MIFYIVFRLIDGNSSSLVQVSFIGWFLAFPSEYYLFFNFVNSYFESDMNWIYYDLQNDIFIA